MSFYVNAATRREVESAERYIRSERTDPFTRDRVMSHIRNGITRPTNEKNGFRECVYDATESRETRSYERDGVLIEYEVPSWTNVKRP
jgi:hypothetical protein